jgi:hypothetical protein
MYSTSSRFWTEHVTALLPWRSASMFAGSGQVINQ